MKLHEKEAKDKLNEYLYSLAEDDIIGIVSTNILLGNDKILHTIPEFTIITESNIVDRIGEIVDIYGLEYDTPQIHIIDHKKRILENVELFKENLDIRINKLLDMYGDEITFDIYQKYIRNYSNGFMDAALDVYSKYEKQINDNNEKILKQNRFINSGLKIIK